MIINAAMSDFPYGDTGETGARQALASAMILNELTSGSTRVVEFSGLAETLLLVMVLVAVQVGLGKARKRT